jgi:hypothetical protein
VRPGRSVVAFDAVAEPPTPTRGARLALDASAEATDATLLRRARTPADAFVEPVLDLFRGGDMLTFVFRG